MPNKPRTTWAGWTARIVVMAIFVYFFADVLVATSAAQEDRDDLPERPRAAHSAWDLNPELATTSTLMLQQFIEAAPRADDEIDFNLLRQTRLPRRPPPVYPGDLAPMDGQQVRIFGFMSPYNSLEDMRNFMLMPTATGCYFCVPPSPREVIFVRMADRDKVQPFVDEPLEVTGTLNLWKENSDEAAHRMFLYVIDDAKIRPVDITAEKEQRAQGGPEE